VLAVTLLVSLGPGASPDQGSITPDSTTRTITDHLQGLRLMSPTAGSEISVRQAEFRWTAIAGSPYYDVRIVTDDGDLVAEQRVAGTEWKLPPESKLRPGAEYYVHVDAYPTGDKALSSEHVPFRVAE
jgi:hypothetical protein